MGPPVDVRTSSRFVSRISNSDLIVGDDVVVTEDFLFTHQCFCGLHPNHPGAIADHVTDLTECIVNQPNLLIGRWDWYDADWTEISTSYKSEKLEKCCLQAKFVSRRNMKI